MSMSSFRFTPRIGYLELLIRIIGYISKMREVKLHFRVSLPHYLDISYVQYDWEKSIYVDNKEALPHDDPIALSNPVIMTHYVDTNLYNDILTGR